MLSAEESSASCTGSDRDTSPSRTGRTRVGRTVDGRLVVLAVVGVYFSVIAIGRSAFRMDLWPYVGVNAHRSVFFDARNVLAAVECRRLGFNPLLDNPCDPEDRVIVYPRVWLLLRFLGLDQSHTVLVGWLLIVVFLTSLLLLVGRLTLWQGVLVGAAVCSPAVMYSVERGNVDVLLFALFVGAAYTWPRHRLWLVAPALLFLAAAAKLYGAFALPALLLTRDRRRWPVVPVAVVGLAVYLLSTRNDVAAVAGAPEGGLLYSYGARILIGHLYHSAVPGEWQGGNLAAQAVAVVPVLVLAAVAGLWAYRHLSPTIAELPVVPSPAMLAFLMGSLIYEGTFLLRKNGDYRLVILLLLLPQLLSWAAGTVGTPRRRLARLALGAVFAALYVGALSPYIGPWDELASWALAGVLAALLVGSVPRVSVSDTRGGGGRLRHRLRPGVR